MGKFSDKLLGAFSLNDDDDYDEDDYEDEEYDDEDYDDDDYEEEKVGLFGRSKKAAPKSEPKPVASQRGRSSQEVCIFKPSSIEDSREITETLLQVFKAILSLDK